MDKQDEAYLQKQFSLGCLALFGSGFGALLALIGLLVSMPLHSGEWKIPIWSLLLPVITAVASGHLLIRASKRSDTRTIVVTVISLGISAVILLYVFYLLARGGSLGL